MGSNLISKTPGSVRAHPSKRLFRAEVRKLSLKLKGKCCLFGGGGDGDSVVALDIRHAGRYQRLIAAQADRHFLHVTDTRREKGVANVSDIYKREKRGR